MRFFSDISFASEVFSAGLHFMHHMCLKQNYKKKKKRIITCWNLWCVNGQIWSLLIRDAIRFILKQQQKVAVFIICLTVRYHLKGVMLIV